MLVAREKEQNILKELLENDDAQFLAVYGRRRVGKTYLIRECLGDKFVFSHAGIFKGTYKEQLEEFSLSLKYYGLTDFEKPDNWLQAFHLLKKIIDNSKKKKKVIFLDELSWMATKRSGFVKALENFWNSYLSAKKDVLLVVCASATSWILNNIVKNKGGLYNRLTAQINLKPFTLAEVEKLLLSKKIKFARKQIVEGYMILGGIPYYWGLMKKDLSFASNIDYLFASDGAPLRNEFAYLYSALFEQPEVYLKIVETLSLGQKCGMDYSELVMKTNQANSGDFSEKINELEECGFVRKYAPFGKKSRGTLVQLIDNFTLFYYKFLNPYPTDEHFFSLSINTPTWKSWGGLAFERVCLQHITQIKDALRIGGVKTNVCSFACKQDEQKGTYGSQIDLLIERKDETINLCEIKFSNLPYVVSEEDVYKMEVRRHDLLAVSKTDFAVIPTLIVYPSNHRNAYSDEFGSIIEAESLFA